MLQRSGGTWDIFLPISFVGRGIGHRDDPIWRSGICGTRGHFAWAPGHVRGLGRIGPSLTRLAPPRPPPVRPRVSPACCSSSLSRQFLYSFASHHHLPRAASASAPSAHSPRPHASPSPWLLSPAPRFVRTSAPLRRHARRVGWPPAGQPPPQVAPPPRPGAPRPAAGWPPRGWRRRLKTRLRPAWRHRRWRRRRRPSAAAATRRRPSRTPRWATAASS